MSKSKEASTNKLPKSMESRGISCEVPPAECGLRNAAFTSYAAVWYGGKCDTCDEFKKGDFIGNDAMAVYDEGYGYIPTPMDEALKKAIKAGIEITPIPFD